MIVIILLCLILVGVLACLRELQHNRTKIAEMQEAFNAVRKEINGRLSNLLEMSSMAAGSEGRAAGRAEERAAAEEQAARLRAEQARGDEHS